MKGLYKDENLNKAFSRQEKIKTLSLPIMSRINFLCEIDIHFWSENISQKHFLML